LVPGGDGFTATTKQVWRNGKIQQKHISISWFYIYQKKKSLYLLKKEFELTEVLGLPGDFLTIGGFIY